ncbi:MAG: carbohydrate ABC transporter permease [Firmicutes bacterium]|nr:carbohydrate ABC transporter permease [Bacillota bacterium]
MNKRYTPAERILYIANYIFLIICVIVCLFPFLNVIAVSLSSSRAISSELIGLLPIEFNFENYRNLIRDDKIIASAYNSVLVTVVGTFLSITLTIFAAYPLSKKRLYKRNAFIMFITFTMLFNGGMIPNFILVKSINLINSYWALWLTGLINTFNMIVLKTFFSEIPDSLEEAAALDGANDIYILFKIMVPISAPAIATISLFYAVGFWNMYMPVLIYINDTAKWTMMAKLIQLIQNTAEALTRPAEGALISDTSLTTEGVQTAAIVISTLPILCVYPFLQKYFVKGVMIGSVKG